ncbi:MAG: glycerophosphodiester phosphodiesterase family protein [Solibacillus sp.]|jgi:glycerophosphoryl diester phosphodiesterase|uniref:glycerophosphodiester phosphodiesterase family protein n=1 Tax=unclassified Solibacillus TaxID=2637870 RepID=UPI0030FC7ECD
MGKKTKIALAIAAASAAAWAGSKAISKPQKRESKEVLQFERPIIIAQHGGAGLAPEHSLQAFNKAQELGVDGFTISVRLTKDEEIIAFHDATVDRTTNGSGYVKDMTLEELKQLNIGYNFESLEEINPYREEATTVLTLRELFETYNDKLFILSIEDSPDTYEGSLMPSKLWRLIEELDVHYHIIVTSPYSEQIDRFNLYAQNRIALGAGESDIKKAITSFTSQFGHLYHPKVDLFVVPLKSGIFNFDSEKFVKFLGDLNVPTIYTGIDDLMTMSRLIRQGAMGIVTNRPDVAEVLLKKVSQ